MLESYSQLSGDELEALSHSEEPWAKVYNGQTGLVSAVISQESMRDYYAGLMSDDARVAAQHHVPSFSISPGSMFLTMISFGSIPFCRCLWTAIPGRES